MATSSPGEAPENGIDLKWSALSTIFENLLQYGEYSDDKKRAYLSHENIIVPEFGEQPLPTKDVKWTTNTIQRPDFLSFMTEDYTPLEFSWKFTKSGAALVRFMMDPVVRQVSPDIRGAYGLFQDLQESALPGLFSSDFDLSWCRVCADSLTCSMLKAESYQGLPGIDYPSQYFAGFEFGPETAILKAYFLPQARSIITSTPPETLITNAINAIEKLNIGPQVNIMPAWQKLLSFFSSLPIHLAPIFEFVSVDCLLPHQNRIKIYIRTPVSSLSNLKHFFLFGKSEDTVSATTQKVLAESSYLWNLLFPGVNEGTQLPSLHPAHTTAGLVFYYEFRSGDAEPVPKVYIPVQLLCQSDAIIAQALETFYKTTGSQRVGENYEKYLGAAFNNRPLTNRVGIQTYISLTIKNGETEITTYLNPECYAT